MLTRLRNRTRTVAFIAMWLIAMTTMFVAPAACAAPGSCGQMAPVTIAPPDAAPAPAMACHMQDAKGPGSSHCDMGCCQEPAPTTESQSERHSAAPSHGDRQNACLTAAPQHSDTALTSVDAPTLDLAATLIPAPAPWIYVATNTHPHSPSSLLPPRDAVARPQGSRAPPASLA